MLLLRVRACSNRKRRKDAVTVNRDSQELPVFASPSMAGFTIRQLPDKAMTAEGCQLCRADT